MQRVKLMECELELYGYFRHDQAVGRVALIERIARVFNVLQVKSLGTCERMVVRNVRHLITGRGWRFDRAIDDLGKYFACFTTSLF